MPRVHHPDPAPDLAALVAAAIEGAPWAWEALTASYGRRVFAMARSRLRDDHLAEEVTQAVFVSLATELRRAAEDATAAGYEERGKFEAWLFRVAMNKVRDIVRKNKRRPEIIADPFTIPDQGSTDTNNPDADHELDALRSAMARLSEADRTVIELRHQAQMGFRAIANMLNEPHGTILARHHRALRKLRAFIEDQGSAARPIESEPTP